MMDKHSLKYVFIMAWLLLFGGSDQAEAQKVALVLSGGGAKGAAHVGVIKALEENNIPIDYIAGTSMGAIIGGLYASGYSAAELEKFVRNNDFDKWVRGELSEEFIYYFKQNDPSASWVSLKLDYDSDSKKLKTQLPTNLISPHQIDFSFLRFFSSSAAAAGYDFDSLFVPFLCVAADIESKKAVVLSDGDLGHAIRASMTYPFYFKTIKIDGKLLFDGGIYNNFPVDIADSVFRPDIIIGSKAVSNYKPPKEDDIISQLQNLIVNETDFTMPEGKGILIEPHLPSVNVIDFSKKNEMIDSGYVAASARMEEIRKIIPRRVSQAELDIKRDEFLSKKPPVIIDTIIITGLKKSQAYYVERLLRHKSRYLTLESIRSEYYKLLADNKIKYIFPTLTYKPATGFYELGMEVKRGEQFVLDFGGNISSSAANSAYAGIEYRFFSNIGLNIGADGYFGRFYSSGNVQVRLDLPMRFPLFISSDFTYNHKDYFKNTTYFLEDKKPSFLVQNESHMALHAGIPARNHAKLVGSVFYGYTKDEYYPTNQFSREDTADLSYFDFITPVLGFELNTLNNKQYATSGTYVSLSFHYISGTERTIPGSTSANTGMEFKNYHQWVQLRFIYDKYFRIVRPFNMGIFADVLLSNQPIFANYTETLLRTPSFEPIPEMKTLFLTNYRATNYAAIGLRAVYNPFKRLFFRLEGFLFQPYEELEQDENNQAVRKREFSNRSSILSGTVVYETPIGPVSLAFDYYDRADQSFSVLFNIGFIIFNKSAFN